jgi:glucosamine-6-phosphate deaminase
MYAQQIILMAYGEQKAATMDAMMNGPVTEELPVSILQVHPKS